MKHKAQESLDILSYPAWESPCSGCKCGTSDCRDCKNAVAVLNLEDLINCQLTLEEIEVLISALLPFTMIKGTKDTKQEALNLIYKLQKQKEMWVSEDD